DGNATQAFANGQACLDRILVEAEAETGTAEPCVRAVLQRRHRSRENRQNNLSIQDVRKYFRQKESFGGAKRDRTADLLHAMQALSQLSYGPTPASKAGAVSGSMPARMGGAPVFDGGF